jgi:hypothetical protein
MAACLRWPSFLRPGVPTNAPPTHIAVLIPMASVSAHGGVDFKSNIEASSRQASWSHGSIIAISSQILACLLAF